MEIIAIREDTWRIEDGFVRCFLLAGSQRAVLIDTGASSPQARALAETVTALPLSLLCTHGDGDHIAGNGEFEEFYMHPDDYTGCGVDRRFPGCRLLPLHDGDRLDLGDRELTILAIPGHTRGSVAILDSRCRTLYTGDSVQSGHIFMFGAHRAPERFAASLQKLAAMSDAYDTLYPSHDAPVLPSSYVQTVLRGWEQVCRGELEGREADMHGTPILSYDAEGCGFYCGSPRR